MTAVRIIIAVFAFTFFCRAQQPLPDPATYIPGSDSEAARLEKAWLVSGDPRLVAWAAELIAQDGRRDLVPDLIGQLKLSVADQRRFSAMDALLDALIQLGARVPADTLSQLPTSYSVQKVILLARAPDNRESLMAMCRTETNVRVWLAAADLLAGDPQPDFARLLLNDLHIAVDIALVTPGFGGGIGGGCGGSFGHGVAGPGWPQVNAYGLSLTKGTVFTGGVHPVRYYSFDFNTGHPDFDCSFAEKEEFVPGLLSQVARIPFNQFRLAARVYQTVTYHGLDSYLAHVEALLSPLNEDFQHLLTAYVRLGFLSPGEANTMRLPVDLTIQDLRTPPGPPLPVPPEFAYLSVALRVK